MRARPSRASGSASSSHTTWEPNFGIFGAGTFIYGTAVTSLLAMLLSVPLGISIALYLSMMAPRRVRSIVGPLVEMLAAIPSVILGFWGILVLGPFLQAHLEPFLHSTLGFLPIFGATPTTGTGLFIAGLILTIMVVPIIASISRDLFLSVPRELQDGATALGATPWEVLRGVVLPSSASGIAAAAFLGLGRALGEAIAVTQVIGAGNFIHASLFQTGDTLASRIADQFQGAASKLEIASLFYLGPDPPRDRAGGEPRRAADHPSLRREPDGGEMTEPSGIPPQHLPGDAVDATGSDHLSLSASSPRTSRAR